MVLTSVHHSVTMPVWLSLQNYTYTGASAARLLGIAQTDTRFVAESVRLPIGIGTDCIR